MSLGRWKKLSSEDKFVNPWWTYRVDKFQLPNGKEGEYNYVHMDEAVFVVPVLDNGKTLWVRQYRYLFDKESVEIPAGRCVGDEGAEIAARRELVEETGMDGDLEKLGTYAVNNGIDDSVMSIFIARNLRPSDQFKPDETEEFESVELSGEEIEKLIDSGEMWDGISISAWHVAKNKL